MANGIVKFLKKIEPEHGTLAHTLFDGFFTFAFAPDETTKPEGVQIRDGMDLKRLMFHVVIALQLCYVFGTYNIGHQHFVALGEYTGFFSSLSTDMFGQQLVGCLNESNVDTELCVHLESDWKFKVGLTEMYFVGFLLKIKGIGHSSFVFDL